MSGPDCPSGGPCPDAGPDAPTDSPEGGRADPGPAGGEGLTGRVSTKRILFDVLSLGYAACIAVSTWPSLLAKVNAASLALVFCVRLLLTALEDINKD